jgi:hypothetical protein
MRVPEATDPSRDPMKMALRCMIMKNEKTFGGFVKRNHVSQSEVENILNTPEDFASQPST